MRNLCMLFIVVLLYGFTFPYLILNYLFVSAGAANLYCIALDQSESERERKREMERFEWYGAINQKHSCVFLFYFGVSLVLFGRFSRF